MFNSSMAAFRVLDPNLGTSSVKEGKLLLSFIFYYFYFVIIVFDYCLFDYYYFIADSTEEDSIRNKISKHFGVEAEAQISKTLEEIRGRRNNFDTNKSSNSVEVKSKIILSK